ncbi:MAG: hypothetical protein IK014_06220 [Lachnospiraceae bacterium]|nr:hypothetical protein [Lachnospiraceae bacterium]
MFDYPGEKIKTVSKVMFWLETITCVVLAFVLGIKEGRYGDTDFNAAIFFSFLIGGPLVAYISTLFLVGFGELVENSSVKAAAVSANSEDTISSTLNNSSKVHPQSSLAQKNKNSKIHKCQNCGMMVNVNPCPKCGFDNSKEANR